ncbi:hypothetical protein BDQ17DRAFT_1392118 [Cyathus striatus]|nr:hypothetical protein BDQ17DRAFT_1392118 [Cyathus striatus]
MADLNPDILEAILAETTHDDLLPLSYVSRNIRHACLPHLFRDVRWPQPHRLDPNGGLDFFPRHLWSYFRRLNLIWPDHWPDASPPAWGDVYFDGGDYYPRHMDQLVDAIPQMTALATMHINCPFFPSRAFFQALMRCKSLQELIMNETLLYHTTMNPDSPPLFTLRKIAFIRVAEALRIGEGPYDPKYREVQYYTREYRRRYKNDALARSAAQVLLFRMGNPQHLTYVQFSGDLMTLSDLAAHEWPCLTTLVLTGHPPRPCGSELVDVVARMPVLEDLRLLFARTNVLGSLKSLAVSNACNLISLFSYTTSIERVCIPAIINHPRVPIGLSRGALQGVLEDMRVGQAGGRVKLLRVMLEDKVHPELCALIALTCPALEVLEVELCGYHDGKSVYAWDEFTDSLAPLNLTDLRLCIQFPEYDDADRGEPWRTARRQCAVALEYRKRTGTHRYEDGG